MQFSFPKLDVSFFLLLLSKTHEPPFRGWLITATMLRNRSAISQKEAIESPEIVLNTTQWGLFGFLFFVFAFSLLYNESVIIFKITYEASSFRVSAIQSSSCYVILETKGSATTDVCWWNILGFGG